MTEINAQRMTWRRMLRKWLTGCHTPGFLMPFYVIIEMSIDGEHWSHLGKVRQPDGLKEHEEGEINSLPYCLQLPATHAAFVRVTVHRNSGWCMLSEIQIE